MSAATKAQQSESEHRGTVYAHLLKVAGYVAWEKLTNPRPKTLHDVPVRTESMTPEWLTQVLCKDHPDARVVAIELGKESQGTTNRRALRVRYNAAGENAGLPKALFNKCSYTLVSRLTVGLADILPGEKGFYNLIEPDAGIEAPRAYYADFDPISWRSCILLEDIASTRGATFIDAHTSISRTQIEGMLKLLATLHGRYWNSPRLNQEFTWLKTPAGHQSVIAKFIGMKDQCVTGFERSTSVLPQGLHAQRDRLWPAYVRSLDLASVGDQTYLHGDSHVGQFYQTAAGAMGLCDWQVALKGSWGYDFAYTLTSSLSVENRRAWEHELMQIYLDQLHASGGPKLAFDDAWLVYRQQTMYPLHAWLWTIGRRAIQPRMHSDAACLSLIERMSNAVVDLESVKALEGMNVAMYETQAVLQTVDQHALPILALCGLALVGNYIMWIENLRLGFRDKTYSMPIGCLFFFLPHDATFLALYSHWFGDINHWFPKLWWYGLCVTVCMELTFLVMLLKYGRRELAPRISQGLFVAIILLGLALCTIAWLVVKSVMDDDLFLVIFGVTVFWCAPFNMALMARRQSAVGQSQRAWLGFLMMPLFYYPATLLLSPGFYSPLWLALGAATVIGGVVNLIYLRALQRGAASAEQ